MPNYSYTAKSMGGAEKTGVMEAASERDLAAALRQEGYVLVSAEPAAKEEKKEAGRPKAAPLSFSFRKPSLTDKIMFTKNLAVMVSAGISLPRALNVLSAQTKNKKFAAAILEIRDGVVKGKSFSDGLAAHPDIFPEFYQSMAKVAEEAGTLEEVLKTLTEHMERRAELESKIKGAMIYPAVIISAMAGIGVLMLAIVVPQLAATFEELGIDLPVTTRAVIAVGTFLANFWFLLPLLALALFLGLRAALKTEKGKRVFDGIILKIPVLSAIVVKNNSASTARTLGSLVSSGVPIVRSLEITAGTLGNSYFKEAVSAAAKDVQKGLKLSEALSPYGGVFPSLVIQMLEVGEETGQTSEILGKLAEFFEQEVTNATKNFAAVIEPVLMLVIGGAVGFFAVSMIQPMYSMLGAI